MATHAVSELKADKFLCLTGKDVRELNLPHYLPIGDAEEVITRALCEGDESCMIESLRLVEKSQRDGKPFRCESVSRISSRNVNSSSNGRSGEGEGSGGGLSAFATSLPAESRSTASAGLDLSLDLDSWQQIGFPPPVVAAVVACKNGVRRAHLIDFEVDGAMLLELYTRDGARIGPVV